MVQVGKAQTVLGSIDSDSLGVTLPHDHLLCDLTKSDFILPPDPNEKALAYQPLSLRNLSWVRYHVGNNLDNVRLDDEQIAIDEVMLFKQAGGNTIVEPTVRGFLLNDNHPLGLVRIAQATGINIIMSTGYYKAQVYPPKLATMTDKEIADEFVRDITVGVGETGVRAGVLKAAVGIQIGRPIIPIIDDTVRKVLRAYALAQRCTGAPLFIHLSCKENLEEIIKTLDDAGVDFNRTVLCHVDLWGYDDLPLASRLLQAGFYLEYDCFGGFTGMVPVLGRPDQPSDAQRCDSIVRLISQGYLKRILVSHDTGMKTQLSCFGGQGYAHILLRALPLMRHKGILDEQIHTIMVENPARLLAFVKPK